MGRIPKPIEIKIEEGNKSKVKLPKVPPYNKPKKNNALYNSLGKKGKELYDYLEPHLTDKQLLKPEDIPALVSMCSYWETFWEADKDIKETGLKQSTVRGVCKNPSINTKIQAGECLRKLFQEFHIMPSRHHYAQGENNEIDEFNAFVGGK